MVLNNKNPLILGILFSVALFNNGLQANESRTLTENIGLNDNDESKFFVGINTGVSYRQGGSNTTDGGGALGGGGTVTDLRFSNGNTMGGQIGYQFSPNFLTFLSYDFIRGDVRWNSDFAAPGVLDSLYKAKAKSDVVMINVGYTKELNDSTNVIMNLGAGIANNSLNDIVESAAGISATINSGTKKSFAARAGIALEHNVYKNFQIGLGVNIDYYGDFTTSKTRNLSGGGTDTIGVYELHKVWGRTFTLRAVINY